MLPHKVADRFVDQIGQVPILLHAKDLQPLDEGRVNVVSRLDEMLLAGP